MPWMLTAMGRLDFLAFMSVLVHCDCAASHLQMIQKYCYISKKGNHIHTKAKAPLSNVYSYIYIYVYTCQCRYILHLNTIHQMLCIARASVFQRKDLTWAELSTAMQRFWAQVSYAELLGFQSQGHISMPVLHQVSNKNWTMTHQAGNTINLTSNLRISEKWTR